MKKGPGLAVEKLPVSENLILISEERRQHFDLYLFILLY